MSASGPSGPLVFIPVGYQDIHKSMDEFEFRSDPITDYGVSCP